jgi:hypothetical protein
MARNPHAILKHRSLAGASDMTARAACPRTLNLHKNTAHIHELHGDGYVRAEKENNATHGQNDVRGV